MARSMDLSKVSTDDLVQELINRPGIVLDTWVRDDVLSLVENDDRFSDLDDAEQARIADDFLDQVGSGLKEILASRGNDYLEEKFMDYDPE